MAKKLWLMGIPEKQLESATWKFRLYIAGRAPTSLLAISNLGRICKNYLKDQYSVEVIDLLIDPVSAVNSQIVAVPTLIRLQPSPEKRIVGDLSNEKDALEWLDIQPQNSSSPDDFRFKTASSAQVKGK